MTNHMESDPAEFAGAIRGKVLWHNGSNGTFFAVVHIVPQENYATCAACNSGNDAATQEAHMLLVKHVPGLRRGKR